MKSVLMVAALIGATILAFHDTLQGQFVYDDHAIIVKNPLIRDLHHIPLIFGTSYWGMNIGQPNAVKGGLYRPITTLSFALNYSKGGLNPRGYHWTNLLLHIGVSLLCILLFLRMGMSFTAAGAAGLLFALLPIHTEAVSNIVGRSDVLSAFFVLVAWILAAGYPGWFQVSLGAISFLLALLSKENALAFWPILIVSDYVIRQRSWKALAKERLLIWIAYGGSLLLYLEWHHLVIGGMSDVGGTPYFTFQGWPVIYFTMAKFTIQHYIQPLLLGAGLCADYTRPVFFDARLDDASSWMYGLLLAGAISFSLYSAIAKKNRIALGMVIFFALLFPVSNFAVRLEVIGAERFLYLPSIGFCMVLGLLFERVARWHKFEGSTLLVSLVLWYGACIIQRNMVWQSDETFWNATLQDAPQSPRAWNGVGFISMNKKKYVEAITFFNKALALNPMLVDAEYNKATAYFLKGDRVQAQAGYLEVLRAKPYDLDSLFHLGLLSEKTGDFKSAARDYALILTLNPLDRPARRNIALLHCRTGHRRLCREELNQFLHDAPAGEPDDDIRNFLETLEFH